MAAEAKGEKGAAGNGSGAEGESSAASASSADGGKAGAPSGNSGAAVSPSAAPMSESDIQKNLEAMPFVPPITDPVQVDPAAGVPDGTTFLSKPDGGSVVTVVNVPLGDNAKAVVFNSGMRIAVDGAGPLKNADPVAKSDTALHGADGQPLDPTQIPYVVIPKDFRTLHPEVHLGDYVAVTYGAKTVIGIVGDVGPPRVLGEASALTASLLGIPAHPVSGGVDRNVRYTIRPGSADNPPLKTADAIKARGGPLFVKKPD